MTQKLIIIVLLLCLCSTVDAQGGTSSPPTWPDQYYAPYIYAAGYPLAAIAKMQNIRYLTLAFVLSGPKGCQAAWGGGMPLDQQMQLPIELENLRAQGGDVIISFGGAGGTELAKVCQDVQSLQEQYQSVLDTYRVTRLDFDIEGDEIHDSDSLERRSLALAALQQEAESDGKPLAIDFTLPVAPSGLTDDGLAVIQSAIDNGVVVDVVNIMTMDFGDAYPPDEMGKLTLQAADSLFKQLTELYPEKTESQVWKMVGLTPMIGLNDSVPEVFTLDDASMVVDYAKEKGIRQIAMWALNRDKACSGNAPMIAETCSGIEQEPFAFSAVFNLFEAEN